MPLEPWADNPDVVREDSIVYMRFGKHGSFLNRAIRDESRVGYDSGAMEGF